LIARSIRSLRGLRGTLVAGFLWFFAVVELRLETRMCVSSDHRGLADRKQFSIPSNVKADIPYSIVDGLPDSIFWPVLFSTVTS